LPLFISQYSLNLKDVLILVLSFLWALKLLEVVLLWKDDPRVGDVDANSVIERASYKL